jgi:two-component system, OmpR family, sensor histidine kinase QseC
MFKKFLYLSTIRILIKKFCSIHYFLMVTLLSILTLVMIFIGVINYWQVYRQSSRILDAELATSASVLNTILENNLDIANYHDEFTYQVLDPRTEQILFKSEDAPNHPLAKFGQEEDGHHSYFDNNDNNTAWRTFFLATPKKHLKIIVAMKRDLSLQFRMGLFLHDMQMLVLIYIIMSFLILFVIQKGLKALNHTVTEISKRDGENLRPIDIERVPLELQPLIKEINRLFLRVDQTMTREKRFTADAAHELRTPLAALKTQVEVAKKELDESKRLQILNNIILGTNRCAHVVDQLLTLSRLEPEAIAISSFDKINLTELTQELATELIPAILEKNLELELTAPEKPIFILGKAAAIGILIRNLVNNSMNYTPSPGVIFINLCELELPDEPLSQDQNQDDPNIPAGFLPQKPLKKIQLQVSDTGPGVPRELQDRIFDRFFRELGNKQPGSGLGLSIVMQVVRLHRASIQARTPRSGKGLEVSVLFPDLTQGSN